MSRRAGLAYVNVLISAVLIAISAGLIASNVVSATSKSKSAVSVPDASGTNAFNLPNACCQVPPNTLWARDGVGNSFELTRVNVRNAQGQITDVFWEADLVPSYTFAGCVRTGMYDEGCHVQFFCGNDGYIFEMHNPFMTSTCSSTSLCSPFSWTGDIVSGCNSQTYTITVNDVVPF